MKILVTGAAGFIGSNLCRYLIQECSHSVIALDSLTYAGNLASLDDLQSNENFVWVQADICNEDRITEIFKIHQPDAVMHLAAESHVDRSIDGPESFIQTNIIGTYRLLQASRSYFDSLTSEKKKAFASTTSRRTRSMDRSAVTIQRFLKLPLMILTHPIRQVKRHLITWSELGVTLTDCQS